MAKNEDKKINKQEEYLEILKREGITPQTFSMFGGGGENINPFGFDRLSDQFSVQDISSWILDPEGNSEELINVARLFYFSKAYVNRVINHYVDIMRLDYNILPEFKTLELPDKDELYESIQEVRNYLDYVIGKTTVRNMLKTVLNKGIYFGYERNDGDMYHIQTLPNEFCRRGVVVNGLHTIEFNFDEFFDGEDDPKFESFDPEFKTLYRKSLTEEDANGWYQLNPEFSVIILSEEEDFSLPFITGLMLDLLDLDDFYGYMKKGIERDVSQILIHKGEIDQETGEPLTNPEILQFFHMALEQGLRDMNHDATVVSTVFDVDSIDFTKSKSSDAGYTSVDTVEDKVSAGSGVSDSLLGKGDSATSLKLNNANVIAYVMHLLEKIEKWVNTRLRERASGDYYFKVRYLPTTYNEDYNDNIYKKSKGLLDIGGSLLYAISSAGINPYEYINMVMLESIMEFKDILELPLNINTTSGEDIKDSEDSEPGRPKSDDGDLSDGGEQTRDDDANDDR